MGANVVLSNETDKPQQTAMSAAVARLARVNGAVSLARARAPGLLAWHAATPARARLVAAVGDNGTGDN
jgi:hypothetical protein